MDGNHIEFVGVDVLFESEASKSRFTIERELDPDELSRRLLGFDKVANRRVVFRVAPRERDVDERLLRLERLEDLQHTKAAPIVVQGWRDGWLYAARPWVVGRRLDSLIETVGPLNLREFAPIASQICMPVAEAHSRGIALGGVRPEQVYLQERNGRSLFVQIVDLGWRTAFASDEAQSTSAPEGTLSTAADSFELGVCFARMLSGEEVPLAAPQRWWTDVGGRLELPPGLLDLVASMLDDEPKRRPPDGQHLTEALIDSMPPAMFRLPAADGSASGDTGRWPVESLPIAKSSESWPASSTSPELPEPTPRSPSVPAMSFLEEEPSPRRRVRLAGIAAALGLLVAAVAWVGGDLESSDPSGVTAAVADPQGPKPRASRTPHPRSSEASEAASSSGHERPDAPVVELGRVVVASTPPAELFIDGTPVGSTPMARELEIGRHELELRSEGHEPWKATVVVRAEETSRFDVALPVKLAASKADGRAGRRPRARSKSGKARLAPKTEPTEDSTQSGALLGRSQRTGGPPTNPKPGTRSPDPTAGLLPPSK